MNRKNTREKAKVIVNRLKENYPNAHCTLDFQTPFQLLVATILSAQCTDKRVNKVTPELFMRFNTPTDLAEANLVEIEDIIQSTGFFRQKAKSIKRTSEILANHFHGTVPEKMEDLIKLPGIGRKTANVILGTAFHKNDGVVVDTHVKRISNRLGFTEQNDPIKIEKDLMKILPQDDWTIYSHLIIEHGRTICKARKPDCMNCFLSDVCPSSKA